MGAVLAKFRKEKTTAAVLEQLEERIQQLEKYTLNTQEQKKRFVGGFLAFSIGIFVIAFCIFYFVYFPPTWRERIMYSIPILLFPLIIILLRRVLTWYFQRKLNKNSNRLTALRAEKKKLLEEVMDKETYKVAVNLLARFGGDKSSGPNRQSYAMTPRVANNRFAPSPNVGVGLAARPTGSGQQLALPGGGGSLSNQPRSGTALTPSYQATPRTSNSSLALLAASGGSGQAGVAPPRQLALAKAQAQQDGQQLVRQRRTPFPIVNAEERRGVMERIMDILIGDGPQDRFAMICKECYAHNGMALKEEFDYTTFRCAFCNALNHARKERPVAPRLPVAAHALGDAMAGQRRDSTSTESSPSDTSSDEAGGEQKPAGLRRRRIMTGAATAEQVPMSAQSMPFSTPEAMEVDRALTPEQAAVAHARLASQAIDQAVGEEEAIQPEDGDEREKSDEFEKFEAGEVEEITRLIEEVEAIRT